MAFALDNNDLLVNILRETCLSATTELSKIDSNPNNFLNTSFGRLINSPNINIDDFPLLSNLPNGSPPVLFENDLIIQRKYSKHQILQDEPFSKALNSLENNTNSVQDDSISIISKSTTIETVPSDSIKSNIPNSKSHKHKPSIYESIPESIESPESLESPQTLASTQQLKTPIRPDLGSRSASVNTLKSQATPIQKHSQPESQLKNLQSPLFTHKKTSSIGSKKQKGLLALGRLIRPKHLANTLVHHNTGSSSISGSSNPDISDSESNKSDPIPSSHLNNVNSTNNNDHISYSEDNLVEELELKHISEKNNSENRNSDQSSNNENIIGADNVNKNQDNHGTSNSEGNTIDSNIDNGDDVNSDTNIENTYDSEVDSIESSDLADSDYDYFNPPVSAIPNNISSEYNSFEKNNRYLNDLDSDDYISDPEDGDYTSLGEFFEDRDYGYDDDDDDDGYSYDEEEDDEDDEYNNDNNSEDDGYYENMDEGSLVTCHENHEHDSDSKNDKNDNKDKNRINSISKISFIKHRPNFRSHIGSTSAQAAKSPTGSSNYFGRRRKSSGAGSIIRPHTQTLVMSTAITPNIMKDQTLNKNFKHGKSFSNLRSLKLEEESKQENKPSLVFNRITPKIKPNDSKLTELIHKSNISLNYYKYVNEKQSEGDRLIDVRISVPKFQINYNSSLRLKVNSSFQVVELIGYILFMIEDKLKDETNEQNPNNWKIYLADDDGEIEDDFGVLDRTREIKSYGADEFVLVECSKDEKAQNDKITPSPLENNGNSSNLIQNTIVEPSMYESIDKVPMLKDGSLATLPSNLTPVIGNVFNNTILSSTLGQQQRPQQQKKVYANDRNFILNDLDSDEEDEKVPKQSDNKRSSRYRYLKHTVDVNDKGDKEKESKLNKFKTRSKTIQSILHNTADHYQLTQQELFRNTNNEESLGNQIIVGSFKKNKFDIFSDDYYSNNMISRDNNKASMYHRWTVWRKQQMSFKNKLPKTLTVDGFQIYLLPFNEFKGSWYDSKTYNFEISQILKIKQNIKVPNNFKIIIKKNSEGIVKKYYLEAKNAKECKEIVSTIRDLAKAYSERNV